MARILCISSQVVRGHVGLSAMVPALQRLGHEVLAVPTIILSNHPGHVRATGTRIEVNTLVSILDVLDANGWLAGLDAVMTGYLPTPKHVGFAARAVDRVRERSADALIAVDPVLGDDPRGLYIDADVATAIASKLVPRADVLTPNRFELSRLSGMDVTSIATAVEAVRRLGTKQVIGTSIPGGDGLLANVSVTSTDTLVCSVTKLSKVPHGTGDLLSGLLVGHHLMAQTPYDALGKAVAGVAAAVAQSTGLIDLVLTVAPGAIGWSNAKPLPVQHIPA